MGNVKLTDVTKEYGDAIAVENMNLDIRDGEFVTLVGPSGCGKSTTLETIAGLTIPTSGTVEISGRDVTNLPPKERGIAMVFQNIALFPHMDVYDNISFGLRLRDYPKDEIDRRVEHAAEVVQLEGLLDRMPEEMSGGQRQRVAIARAIVREPDVFLMDEPLANLDAKLRVHMRTELQRLHKELDTTIIYVTHDQAEAMTMSDRIAVINDGTLQQAAPPLTCYNEPANLFVAGFIGSPSMNFIEGNVTEDSIETANFAVAFDPATIDGLGPGDRVILGVRPEDVYLTSEAFDLSDTTSTIEARSDVLEPMGNEIFVYLLLGDTEGGGMGETDSPETVEIANDELLMSVDPDEEIAENEDIEIVLDRSKMHIFDVQSGEALTHDLTGMSGSASAASEAETDD